MPFPFPLPMGVAAYDPASTALFARMSPSPSYARKRVIDKLVKDLKRYGIWSKLDILYVFAAHSQNPGLLNWISTSYTSGNNGATFTTDRGFTGDAATAYLSTSYSAGTGQFARNDHCFGVWSRTSGGASMGGVANATGTAVDMSYDGSGVQFRDAAFAQPDSFACTRTGHIAQSRTGSGAFTAYQGGSSLGSPARSLSANPTGNFTLLALNLDSTPASFTGGQLGAAHFGKGLTGTEIANLSASLQSYMTAVGA
jgi:hypothetical protein